jgi:serine/threonine protein kinase
MIEENWSGRGQHPEFATNEREVVNSILQVQDVLGSSSSAIVQSVRCRRILLARKTIRCIPGRTMTREKVIEEVVHLNRLKHAHIVQLIGTYIIGQELSILMYPAADYNLEAFMEQCDSVDLSIAGSQFMICLSNAIHHLHLQLIKHMDIKPQNILVRFVSSWMDTVDWKVYLADFGISRSYKTLEATETEGPTMYTRKYAAPEVVDQDRRGLPADIFSLDCVFAELLARTTSLTTGKTSFERLQAVLCANEVGDKSYHANTGPVRDFLDSLIEVPDLPWVGLFMYGIFPRAECIALIKRMMDIDPVERPEAGYIVAKFGTSHCCNEGPERLEAASPPEGSV